MNNFIININKVFQYITSIILGLVNNGDCVNTPTFDIKTGSGSVSESVTTETTTSTSTVLDPVSLINYLQ